jgi:hypothetical protein
MRVSQSASPHRRLRRRAAWPSASIAIMDSATEASKAGQQPRERGAAHMWTKALRASAPGATSRGYPHRAAAAPPCNGTTTTTTSLGSLPPPVSAPLRITTAAKIIKTGRRGGRQLRSIIAVRRLVARARKDRCPTSTPPPLGLQPPQVVRGCVRTATTSASRWPQRLGYGGSVGSGVRQAASPP